MRYFVVFLGLCGLAFLVWLLVPKALDMNIVEAKTVHTFSVGQHQIQIVLSALVDGDNGAAMVQIYNGSILLETRESAFNYDTLQNQAPAHVRYAWLDKDMMPDLLLELQNETVYISSQSGKVVVL
jgi:hypothetical protein